MDRLTIEAVLQNSDLLTLVEQAGGQMRQNGDGWRGACPLHHGDNPTSFAIFRGDDNLYHWKCFSQCNAGGDAIEFVKVWRGLDFIRSVEYLGGADYKADPQELARMAEERNQRAQERAERERVIAVQTLADLRAAERHVFYHEHAPDWVSRKWLERGLNESWQGFYYLGGCDDFVINDGYHTPTLTIPILDEKRQLLNIRHRLLKPQYPKDKYRPERIGLPSEPFLAFPELGYDGDFILVVEGEVKAAVTYSVIGGMDCQVIGVPGEVMFGKLVDRLVGKSVIVCPDPGAEDKALAFAKAVGGRYFELPAKIDDYILEAAISENDIFQFIKHARKVK